MKWNGVEWSAALCVLLLVNITLPDFVHLLHSFLLLDLCVF